MDRTVPKGALLAWGAGAALLVLGLALVATRYSTVPTGESGWFAFAPYATSNPSLFVVTTRELWGAGALALGLTCVAAGAGYVLGTRRPARQGAPVGD